MNYHLLTPTSLVEMLEMKSLYGEDASVLSGGTDLIVNLKSGMVNPKYIISSRKVYTGKDLVRHKDNQLIIEGNATLNDIENNEYTQENYPELIEGISMIGSKQIRNYATIIGNVCNASPAGDSLPPLLVNNAEIVLSSLNGSRTLKIDDFLIGPRKTAIRHDEVATKIIITKEIQSHKYAKYFKLTRTRSVDISGLGVCIKMYNDTDVRIALGAVAPTCIRCNETEIKISKLGLLQSDLEKISEMLSDCASPISDLRASREFRLALIKHHSKKMLMECQENLKRGDSL